MRCRVAWRRWWRRPAASVSLEEEEGAFREERRPFSLERVWSGRDLQMEDVYIAPGIAQIFGDEAAVAVVRFVFAAEEAGSVEFVS